ncbi:MAG: thioredoxin family protein [Phycisphaerales bacterium]|nr:thioredoxin family protein [Phycisphaerales bacterium]
MAQTPSTMVSLGNPANHFNLPDVVSGKQVSLADLAGGKGLLVMFICAHCPFVMLINEQLAALGRDYGAKGLKIVAICSNDVTTHPDDAPEKLKAQAETFGFTFPYLYDRTQEVAKLYQAACTPDFFLYDAERRLAYRGQLDDARPKNGKPVTGKDLRAAIDAVLAGKAPSATQTPSIGCNIKWTPGNEPAYATAAAGS